LTSLQDRRLLRPPLFPISTALGVLWAVGVVRLFLADLPVHATIAAACSVTLLFLPRLRAFNRDQIGNAVLAVNVGAAATLYVGDVPHVPTIGWYISMLPMVAAHLASLPAQRGWTLLVLGVQFLAGTLSNAVPIDVIASQMLATAMISGLSAHGREVADQLRAALSSAHEKAAIADRTKSRFLANISHEIRTPLNGVLGANQIMLDGPLDDAQRDLALLIHRTGHSLGSLINDLLDLSKLETSELTLGQEDVDLRSLIEDVLELFATDAWRRSIDLQYTIAPTAPPVIVGDHNRIRQVLVNLVGNAMKFTEHGSVVVEVQPLEQHMLRFNVRDTGIGIAPEALAQLFKPFQQIDDSPTRRHQGTGLGLAVSRELARLMKGDVWVDRSGGAGSTFSFRIRTAVSTTRPAAPPASLAGQRLLIIDPQRGTRSTLRAFAEDAQMQVGVLQTTHGHEESLARRWHTIVLSSALPEFEALLVRLLHAPGPTPRLLVLTAAHEREALAIARRHGVHAALLVPLRRAQVWRLLDGAAPTLPSTLRATSPQRGELRILVAEDNAVNREVIRSMLERLGYRAHVVEDGAEAVRACEAADYDLVLMDVLMPVMDGLAATRALRAREGFQARIVGVSASAMPEHIQQCRQAGMDDFLPKPISVPDLARLLDACAPRPVTMSAPRDELRVPDMLADMLDLPEYLQLLRTFVEQARSELARMHDAAERADADTLTLAAHSLKGSAGMIGAEQLSRVAATVEELGRARRLTDVHRHLEDVRVELGHTERQLER
jgi:two-component system sensor histidine kinase/response regulator